MTCGDLICSRGLKKRRRKIPSGHCLCTRLTRTTSAPSKCASRVCCDPCCRWNRCATCSLSFTYGCAAVGVCVGRLLTWLAACYYSDSAQAGPQAASGAGVLQPMRAHPIPPPAGGVLVDHASRHWHPRRQRSCRHGRYHRRAAAVEATRRGRVVGADSLRFHRVGCRWPSQLSG